MNRETTVTLYGESFSPWTKKARWALEYCGLIYNYKEYTPTLSEPRLRWQLRQFTGSVSVPLLFANKEVLRGSWEIANYANNKTDSNRLGDMSEIKFWNDLSEAALAEGRTRVVRGILNNDQALQEGLPSFVPNVLRRPLRFIARDAVKRLDKKYAHLLETGAIEKALIRTRESLHKSNSDYLLDGFSYADMTMAVVLEVIAPIAKVEPPLGPVTQEIWHDSVMTEKFQDLVEWRNRLAGNTASSYSQFNFNKE